MVILAPNVNMATAHRLHSPLHNKAVVTDQPSIQNLLHLAATANKDHPDQQDLLVTRERQVKMDKTARTVKTDAMETSSRAQSRMSHASSAHQEFPETKALEAKRDRVDQRERQEKTARTATRETLVFKAQSVCKDQLDHPAHPDQLAHPADSTKSMAQPAHKELLAQSVPLARRELLVKMEQTQAVESAQREMLEHLAQLDNQDLLAHPAHRDQMASLEAANTAHHHVLLLAIKLLFGGFSLHWNCHYHHHKT